MTEPLPPGWAWSKVGELSTFVRGVTFKKSDVSSEASSGLVPIARAGNVESGRARLDQDIIYVSKNRVAMDQYLLTGDILIATSSGSPKVVGKSAIISEDWWGAHGAFMGVIRSNPSIYSGYLGFFVRSDLVRHIWRELAAGTNINNLKRDDIMATTVPLPPVAEQKRIVVAIEEHFSRINAAESAAQTALTRLDTLRRAILTAAFSGHLIEPLNLDQTSANHTLSWTSKNLSDLLDYAIGGIWGSKSGEEEVDVDVVRVTEFTPNGGLNTATAARRSVTNKQYSSRLLKKGDILLEKSGGGPTTPVGRVALFHYHTGPAICTNFMQLMRPKHSVIRSKFLFLQLHLWHIQGRTAKLQKGSSNIRNLQTKQYLAEVVSYPDLARQDRIIAVIEEHFSRIDAAKASLERCLQRCNAMRRSILEAAFSGRLAEQDPSDEPASVLLERIAAEPPKRRTKRKSA